MNWCSLKIDSLKDTLKMVEGRDLFCFDSLLCGRTDHTHVSAVSGLHDELGFP